MIGHLLIIFVHRVDTKVSLLFELELEYRNWNWLDLRRGATIGYKTLARIVQRGIIVGKTLARVVLRGIFSVYKHAECDRFSV